MRKFLKYLKSVRLKNKKLIKRYPWLKPYEYRFGYKKKYHWLKNYDYSWLRWNWMKGWDIAFGDMFLKELDQAIKKLPYEEQKHFHIIETKEKYGMARTEVSHYTSEIEEIIDKYEFISQGICCFCGKPDVPMIGSSWVCPECYDCFYNRMKEDEQKREDLLPLYKELAQKEPWIIPNKRQEKRWNENGDIQIKEYDISDTLKIIRDKYKRRCEHYEKRISRSRHSAQWSQG